ncbi:Uncharacterised protein [Mycobacteroides abscessus subsp. abscessus]|nr:Uncharacterised protein [Mycobacteroides abscessus subsp. abscessus]
MGREPARPARGDVPRARESSVECGIHLAASPGLRQHRHRLRRQRRCRARLVRRQEGPSGERGGRHDRPDPTGGLEDPASDVAPSCAGQQSGCHRRGACRGQLHVDVPVPEFGMAGCLPGARHPAVGDTAAEPARSTGTGLRTWIRNRRRRGLPYRPRLPGHHALAESRAEYDGGRVGPLDRRHRDRPRGRRSRRIGRTSP